MKEGKKKIRCVCAHALYLVVVQDEIDALAVKRGGGDDGLSVADRV